MHIKLSGFGLTVTTFMSAFSICSAGFVFAGFVFAVKQQIGSKKYYIVYIIESFGGAILGNMRFENQFIVIV